MTISELTRGAGIAASLAGLVIGIPSLRVKGLYLCIATLAAQFIFEFIFIHWESMTHGIRGINVPAPAIGAYVFDTERKFYYLTLVIAVLVVGFARNLIRSRVGRAFVAIRDRGLSIANLLVDRDQHALRTGEHLAPRLAALPGTGSARCAGRARRRA